MIELGIYRLVMFVGAYCLFPIFLLIRLWVTGKSSGNLLEKMGAIPSNIRNKSHTQRAIWIHAVSYGEVKTVAPLVHRLQKEYSDICICFSSTTGTGYGLVCELFTDNDQVLPFYFPFDSYLIIKNYLKQINPACLIIVETELWMELLEQCQNIPCYLINARLTDRSARNYQLPILKNLINKAISQIDYILPQSQLDYDRFSLIGAKDFQLEIMPNLKWAGITKSPQDIVLDLKNKHNIQNHTKILVAGSTHPTEETLILQVYREIVYKFPNDDIRLILAPRHIERLHEVVQQCDKYKLSSQINTKWLPGEVLVVDEMGVLTNYYSIADLVFLGGTWADIGGHNPLEPAVYGVPIMMGQYTYKMSELLETLLAQSMPIHQVQEPKQLAKQCIDLLSDSTRSKHDLDILDPVQIVIDRIMPAVDPQKGKIL